MQSAALSPPITSDLAHPDRLRVAVVGDVHGNWDEYDAIALGALNVDLVLFVGDFGNEDVDIVRVIAACPTPKAVILGNHDAWHSLTNRRSRPRNSAFAGLPENNNSSNDSVRDRVRAQLEALGEDHVGFSRKRVADKNVTVLGGRPFSRGGGRWREEKDFYKSMFGISDGSASARRIFDEALAVPHGHVRYSVGRWVWVQIEMMSRSPPRLTFHPSFDTLHPVPQYLNPIFTSTTLSRPEYYHVGT